MANIMFPKIQSFRQAFDQRSDFQKTYPNKLSILFSQLLHFIFAFEGYPRHLNAGVSFI